MGLLKCVDCGHMVSDRARACPQCGCPVEFTINEYELIRQEYDIVIHPKYGRGRIIDTDQTCITILFENTEERKKFLKTAVMPMLKFLNEGYKQELLKKEEKTNEAHIQEQIENKIDAFWDSVEDWKKSNWKHADYVKIFWEYNGEYKEKTFITNQGEFTYEDSPVGAILVWMKQTNHDEEIVIPEIINDTLVTFVAESFSNSDFCYKDCHAYELGFSNRIRFPDTVRYIENIRAYLENNIEITADDDAYISADIMNAKSEYLMDMI